uniref:Reverse transcriptase domain-containing protein n=1 Tax=Monopterus albus TaxID=43700 RepID=A0A3Q3PY07_MONAL
MIRSQIDDSVLDPSVAPICSAVFDQFEPISLAALMKVVQLVKPSYCPLDIMPAALFKEVFHSIGLDIVNLINGSLASGIVPTALKHAAVQPILKKPNLDSTVLSNFRPVSKLPYLSKILEKTIFTQLQTFLENNGIFEKFQSGFKTHHSTESALLQVFNNLVFTVDEGNTAILILLDLSAAFDTVDHRILLSHLQHSVGLHGNVLKWFESYLSDRSFAVHIDEFSSSVVPLNCGVPQGSILGPVLFSLYLLPLGSIFMKYGLSFHCYADDIQIYLPLNVKKSNSFQTLMDCLRDIKAWLSHNFLHINETKTECVVIGNSGVTGSDIPSFLASYLRPHVRNLGVVFDGALKLDEQIKSVVKASFFQLRLLAKVKHFLSFSDFEKAIHAFISTKLDYYNALYTGISQALLSRLQLVQNAAARLLTNMRRHEHITPVLASLHWLPVRFRIDFKLLMFVYKAVHGLAPLYISELVCFYTPERTLRSSNQLFLEVPKSRRKHWGDRAFSVRAPILWNGLPWEIRSAACLFLNHFLKRICIHGPLTILLIDVFVLTMYFSCYFTV